MESTAKAIAAAEERGFAASVSVAIAHDDTQGLLYHAHQGALLQPPRRLQGLRFPPDDHGPVSHAAIHGSALALGALLFGSFQLSPNERDREGRTPLMHLIRSSSTRMSGARGAENTSKMIGLLVDAGVKGDETDIHGNNLLHYAMQYPFPSRQLPHAIVSRGERAENRAGLTPGELARAHRFRFDQLQAMTSASGSKTSQTQVSAIDFNEGSLTDLDRLGLLGLLCSRDTQNVAQRSLVDRLSQLKFICRGVLHSGGVQETPLSTALARRRGATLNRTGRAATDRSNGSKALPPPSPALVASAISPGGMACKSLDVVRGGQRGSHGGRSAAAVASGSPSSGGSPADTSGLDSLDAPAIVLGAAVPGGELSPWVGLESAGWQRPGRFGWTALHWAAHRLNLEAVVTMLGVAVGQRYQSSRTDGTVVCGPIDCLGQTALHCAVRSCTRIADMPSEETHGYSSDTRHGINRTRTVSSIALGMESLSQGSDSVSTGGELGGTSADVAGSSEGQFHRGLACVRALVLAYPGACTQRHSVTGFLPLHVCVAESLRAQRSRGGLWGQTTELVSLIRLLREVGCSPTEVDARGCTPLDLMQESSVASMDDAMNDGSHSGGAARVGSLESSFELRQALRVEPASATFLPEVSHQADGIELTATRRSDEVRHLLGVKDSQVVGAASESPSIGIAVPSERTSAPRFQSVLDWMRRILKENEVGAPAPSSSNSSRQATWATYPQLDRLRRLSKVSFSPVLSQLEAAAHGIRLVGPVGRQDYGRPGGQMYVRKGGTVTVIECQSGVSSVSVAPTSSPHMLALVAPLRVASPVGNAMVEPLASLSPEASGGSFELDLAAIHRSGEGRGENAGEGRLPLTAQEGVGTSHTCGSTSGGSSATSASGRMSHTWPDSDRMSADSAGTAMTITFRDEMSQESSIKAMAVGALPRPGGGARAPANLDLTATPKVVGQHRPSLEAKGAAGAPASAAVTVKENLQTAEKQEEIEDEAAFVSPLFLGYPALVDRAVLLAQAREKIKRQKRKEKAKQVRDASQSKSATAAASSSSSGPIGSIATETPGSSASCSDRVGDRKSTPALPPKWERAWSERVGRYYYYHSESRETQWETPKIGASGVGESSQSSLSGSVTSCGGSERQTSQSKIPEAKAPAAHHRQESAGVGDSGGVAQSKGDAGKIKASDNGSDDSPDKAKQSD